MLHRLLASTTSPYAASITAKLEEAELPVRRGSYLTITEAMAAFEEVLGSRLLRPPFTAKGVLAGMKKRIEALGLTRSDCVAVAKVAGESWRGVIRAESLVRQADKLLAESHGQLPLEGQRASSPVELNDDEI